jgi:hypothetical protein
MRHDDSRDQLRALAGALRVLAQQNRWLRRQLRSLKPEPPATVEIDGALVSNPEAWPKLHVSPTLRGLIDDEE